MTSAERVNRSVWMIWSNEHGAWWMPEYMGYTHDVRCAGRYTKEQALRICRWRGKPRIPPNEVKVIAPEFRGYQENDADADRDAAESN